MKTTSDSAKTEKVLKTIGPLQAEYNKIAYPTSKGVKTINIVNTASLLNIKNLTEGEPFEWKLSDGSTGSSNTLEITFPAGKNELTCEITQGIRKTVVTLKKMPDFNLSTLIVYDKMHKARYASGNQTLYMVGHGNIEAIAKGDAPAYTKTFTHPDLTWSIITEDQSDPQASYAGKSTFLRDFGANPVGVDIRRKTIEARDADGGTMGVKVQVVDEGYSKKALAGKTPTILGELNKINRLLGPIKKYLPCDWEILESFSSDEFEWSNADYMEEDPKSRHTFQVNETTFKLSKKDIIKVKCGMPVVAFGYPIASVYIGFSVDAGISVTPKYKVNYETKVGKLEGKAEGGLTVYYGTS